MGERIGVVVAQLGGPRDASEVAPFIRAVFADPDTVALRGGRLTRGLLGTLVAGARGGRVRRAYGEIGGGSPILPVTQGQARLVEAELVGRGHDARAAVAMRHGRPDTADAVRELLWWGAERLVLLPLYPQRCSATTGSAERELLRVLDALGPGVPVSTVDAWHLHPSFVAAQAAMIVSALGADGWRPNAIVFVAHGVPERLASSGDPYVTQVRETAAALAAALPFDMRVELGFQSRAGPVRWVGPDVREVVRTIADEGVRSLCIAPLSFVSDHLETLHELDIVLARIARRAGILEYRRAPTFNGDPCLGRVLADVMEDHLCTMS